MIPEICSIAATALSASAGITWTTLLISVDDTLNSATVAFAAAAVAACKPLLRGLCRNLPLRLQLQIWAREVGEETTIGVGRPGPDRDQIVQAGDILFLKVLELTVEAVIRDHAPRQ